MIGRSRSRLATMLTVVLAGFLLTAQGAWGDVEPTIKEATAGSDADIGFLVNRGCDGSPTTALTVEIPAGASDPRPGPVPGFTAAVQGGSRVTWTGGLLPNETPQLFPLKVKLPHAGGASVAFPTVQTCQVGEFRRTQSASGGQPVPSDLTAPTLLLRGSAAAQQPPAAVGQQPGALPRQDPGAASAQQVTRAAQEPTGGVAAGGGGTARSDLRMTALVALLVAGIAGGALALKWPV